MVRGFAAVGIPHEEIGAYLGCDPKTLRLRFREELDKSHVEANAKVAGRLFQKALEGDTAAMIFWMKTRAGWNERPVLGVGKDGKLLEGPMVFTVVVD